MKIARRFNGRGALVIEAKSPQGTTDCQNASKHNKDKSFLGPRPLCGAWGTRREHSAIFVLLTPDSSASAGMQDYSTYPSSWIDKRQGWSFLVHDKFPMILDRWLPPPSAFAYHG